MSRVLALTFTIVVLATGAVLALAAGPTSASPPPASYGPVTLTVDTSCTFTAKATWSHTRVDSVQFTLHMGLSDQQDTVAPRGHNVGATMTLGVDSTTRTFYVTADFYLNGAPLDEESSTSIDAACAFLL
jgi:hypothetical protein